MWPWNRQGTDAKSLQELQADFATLKAETRAALREVSELSERAYKFLKRAEARARRELDEPNQEPEPSRPRETPATSSSPRAQWGPRARRLARLSRRDPADEPESEPDGVPS